MPPTQQVEIYCVFCRCRLRWYYGWYCPARWPFLGGDKELRA